MLNTERNTVSMGRKVRSAAFDAGLGRIGELQTDFRTRAMVGNKSANRPAVVGMRHQYRIRFRNSHPRR